MTACPLWLSPEVLHVALPKNAPLFKLYILSEHLTQNILCLITLMIGSLNFPLL